MPAETPRKKDGGDESTGLVGVAITGAGILVAAGIFAAIPELRDALKAAVSGDTGEVRREIDELGAAGIPVVLALGLIHTVVWYPAEILDTVTGFAYGFGPGLALVHGVWMLSAMVAYAMGDAAARPLLLRLAGRERFERAETLIAEGGVTLLLLIRLVPIIPFSLMCFACGAARVPFGRYMWTTFVGYLPITAIFVYFGSRLDSLSPTDPRLIGSALVLVAMLLVTRWVSPRLRGPAPGREAEEAE